MLDKLRAHFGDRFTVSPDRNTTNRNYHWFQTPDNIVIGFPINEIHKSELDMLRIFLNPIEEQRDFAPRNAEESWWATLLFEGNDIRDDDQLNENLRFIHFQLKEELQEWDTFTDVLKSFFPAKTIVIWENPFSGVFIDLEPKMTDTVEHLFESIVDTVASDFFVEISLYIGIGNVALTEAKSRYQLERETFQIVKQLVNKPIYKGEEELPFLLIGEAPPVTLQKFTDQTLSQIIEERELIHSIKVYLDCNMNISHAAKKLFLHRNTMQYRVDKFIEKTGIDIRHFRSAVSIYLALLIERNIH